MGNDQEVPPQTIYDPCASLKGSAIVQSLWKRSKWTHDNHWRESLGDWAADLLTEYAAKYGRIDAAQPEPQPVSATPEEIEAQRKSAFRHGALRGERQAQPASANCPERTSRIGPLPHNYVDGWCVYCGSDGRAFAASTVCPSAPQPVSAEPEKCPRCGSPNRATRLEVFSDSSHYDYRECGDQWHRCAEPEKQEKRPAQRWRVMERESGEFWLERSGSGEWVTHDDYAALRAENARLEKELAGLRESHEELRKALQVIVDQIGPCERMRGTPNYACRWCYAFDGDPKQVHHSADCGYNNARAALAKLEGNNG